jgi:hypothetical protein
MSFRERVLNYLGLAPSGGTHSYTRPIVVAYGTISAIHAYAVWSFLENDGGLGVVFVIAAIASPDSSRR